MPDVIYLNTDVVYFGTDKIMELKAMATHSPKLRSRFCMHQNNSQIQEMIICLAKGTDIAPHRHPSKTESFHLIEGSGNILIYDDAGLITERISFSKNTNTFYRINKSFFHTIVPLSDFLLFHEVTDGPHDPSLTEYM